MYYSLLILREGHPKRHEIHRPQLRTARNLVDTRRVLDILRILDEMIDLDVPWGEMTLK
jgi:hypothetical protein